MSGIEGDESHPWTPDVSGVKIVADGARDGARAKNAWMRAAMIFAPNRWTCGELR